MIEIVFFNFLDVLNVIFCLFSGTVNDIYPPKNSFDLFPTNKK